MKILWVKAGGLIPPDSGGKIRSYNLLRELAKENSVTFFSFYAADPNDIHQELNSIFQQVVCVLLDLPAAKSFGDFSGYAVNLLTRQPYNIAKYCRRRVRDELSRLLRHETFDVIICDFLMAAGVIPWEISTPKVLFAHNVESQIWERHYQVAQNPLWKALSWREWRTMHSAERTYSILADHVLTVSEDDSKFFRQFLDAGKVSVIPTGVDVEYFRPSESSETPDSLVFTGSMDWLPNEDGIIYFVKEVLPLVRQQTPNVSLTVVGRKPSRRLADLAASERNVRLTGWVADIRPFLSSASVCVVPLRIGSGTRLKIFEAMSMGKAVISTTIGAEGLPVRDGEHLLIADDPSAFASRALQLLRNPMERQRLGSAARKLVSDKYSWAQATNDLAQVLSRVAEEHSR
ncbi:MAG TPA: glycosyltransferase family 4 protein [Terriglobales bacterium]